MYSCHTPIRFAGKDGKTVALRIFVVNSRQIQNLIRCEKLIFFLLLRTILLPFIKSDSGVLQNHAGTSDVPAPFPTSH